MDVQTGQSTRTHTAKINNLEGNVNMKASTKNQIVESSENADNLEETEVQIQCENLVLVPNVLVPVVIEDMRFLFRATPHFIRQLNTRGPRQISVSELSCLLKHSIVITKEDRMRALGQGRFEYLLCHEVQEELYLFNKSRDVVFVLESRQPELTFDLKTVYRGSDSPWLQDWRNYVRKNKRKQLTKMRLLQFMGITAEIVSSRKGNLSVVRVSPYRLFTSSFANGQSHNSSLGVYYAPSHVSEPYGLLREPCFLNHVRQRLREEQIVSDSPIKLFVQSVKTGAMTLFLEFDGKSLLHENAWATATG
jgi:hypothetical protein